MLWRAARARRSAGRGARARARERRRLRRRRYAHRRQQRRVRGDAEGVRAPGRRAGGGEAVRRPRAGRERAVGRAGPAARRTARRDRRVRSSLPSAPRPADRRAAGANAARDPGAARDLHARRRTVLWQRGTVHARGTHDVELPGDGSFVYGALLTPKGMIVVDGWAARLGATVSYTVPAHGGGRERALAIFTRSVPPRLARVSDRTSDVAVYRLAGPGALAVAVAAGLEVPPTAGHVLPRPVGGKDARATEGAPFVLQVTVPAAAAALLA